MEKPKIRFKGYQEDWEQRKLGDIASSFEYGLNAAAKEYDGENKYIRITDIDDNTHEFLTDNLTSPDIDLTGADNYKLTEGDILFARTGASVGKSYIYRNSDGLVYYAGFLIRARIKEEYDAEFVFQNTLTDRYNKYIAVTSQRSGQPGVNAQEYAEFEIEVPKKEEQTKIGTYFRNIDHLITLHQRKCEEMKTLKKYMLQKMFPQNGQLVPQIRFSGFTEDWEQRKLDDVLKRRIEQRQQSEEYPRLAFASGQGVIPLSERKTNNREQLTKDEYTKKYLVTELNDIVYNPANVKYGAIDRNKCGRGLISPIYVTFTTNEVPGFIERIVTSHDFQQRALRFEEGTVTKRQSVNPEDLVTLDILVAPKREEQQKIATYFDSLDHLITLHQQKCDELRNIKKFMLQNMFI